MPTSKAKGQLSLEFMLSFLAWIAAIVILGSAIIQASQRLYSHYNNLFNAQSADELSLTISEALISSVSFPINAEIIIIEKPYLMKGGSIGEMHLLTPERKNYA